MSGKKVAFKKKPTSKEADEWVGESSAPAKETEKPSVEDLLGPMKRLTLDIPEDLHRQIKSQAAMSGVTMAKVLRLILEEKFAGQGRA